MSYYLTALVFLLIVFMGVRYLVARLGTLVWLDRYIWQVLARKAYSGHQHVIFCFVDHFEPRWGGERDLEKERRRVQRWVDGYPQMANDFVDADGCNPKHSYFFPAEEYEAEHIDALVGLCRDGYGEVEVHLHHDNDTSDNLRNTLLDFANTLHTRHGALSKHASSNTPAYAFIHGNWVLDNSGKDGRWCGVNDEIRILSETGCYADFTFPCAPHYAQPRQINSIYYAEDDVDKPKSHNTGVELEVGVPESGDLMLITGPLGLNWRNRKLGFLPRIENSDVRSNNHPTTDRIDYWVKTGITVKGRPDWVFVKIHTHGAPDREAEVLLGQPLKDMHRYLGSKYNDGERYSLHYVSAREMYNIAKAAEAGCGGNPGDYRDYVLPPPSFKKNVTSEQPY